jgi:hypothetical protein
MLEERENTEGESVDTVADRSHAYFDHDREVPDGPIATDDGEQPYVVSGLEVGLD